MGRSHLVAVFAVTALLSTPCLAKSSDTAAAHIDDLLSRAEALVQLGISEAGAGRSFEEALELVESAEESLQDSELRPERQRSLDREVAAVRENLELAIELYDGRFFGAFPLARLIVPSLLADGGFAVTEQMFHPPRIAAAEIAARSFTAKVREFDYPYLVLRSSPSDRELREITREALLKEGLAPPVTRRKLTTILDDDELTAFDEGSNDPELLRRIVEGFDAAHLIVVTVDPVVEVNEVTVKVILKGDLWTPGEIVQGSAIDASPVVRETSFLAIGVARDRRGQFRTIVGMQALLLTLAMIWASQVRWNPTEPLKIIARIAIGVALFLFGRIFILAVVILLRKFLPDASDLVVAAFWWPAALGLLAILGGGMVAWLLQARVTDILPGTRGARAVGTIFALTAVGASSYFVAPLLLLDGISGLACFAPYLVATLGLAILFGFAARTGPPVPHYFMVGPILVAPLAGMALLTASPASLWTIVGLAGLLSLIAWVRHRYAVSHGIEEPEPTQEEAAAEDQEKLDKLREKISKKR